MFNINQKRYRILLFGIPLALLLYYFRYLFYTPIAGASIAVMLNQTPTKIFQAAEAGDLATVKSFFRRGGSPHMTGHRSYAYQTLLHWAGTPEVAEYLINMGLDIHAQDEFGQTPLHTASSAKVADLLLDHGADPYDAPLGMTSNADGSYLSPPLTPFHTARSKPIVETLFAHTTDTLCSDTQRKSQVAQGNSAWCSFGNTPLHNAKTGDAIAVLIDHGFDVSVKNSDSTILKGRTPLHQASSGEVAKALIDYGADIHAKTEQGLTPLHTAPSAEVVEVLLQNGADINARDAQGRTPLHTAAAWEVAFYQKGDSQKIAQRLLAKGLDVNGTDQQGRTPLHLAMEIIKKDCLTPPYKAKGYKDVTISVWGQPCVYNIALAEFLIKSGADVNAKDNNGQTPLFYTARKIYNTQAAGLLIQSGAEVNARDNRGNTPLVWSTNRRERQRLLQAPRDAVDPDTTFFRLLLDKGADANAENNERSTALQAVNSLDQERYGDLKRLLRQYGAKGAD
ncbi:MAG: ankyrin repeat domain-containing protein [Cyanobacteria bacterium P01_A01_bin.15]